MTSAKTRHDSVVPQKVQVRAASGQSLIPPPEDAPPDEALAAYASVATELDALPEDVVETRRVDASAAAGKARKLADDIHGDAALLARFHKVAASGEFSARSLDLLPRYGLALWYAAHMQGTVAPHGRAKIPAAAKTKATALRTRMQKLARYHFGEHADEGPVVGRLGALRSDQGLAHALLGYADLYARHPAIVSTDRTNFLATDEADARKESAAILDLLGAGPNGWPARTSRAWTALLHAYDDVRRTGEWMFRATPEEAARRFPSLVTESRAPAKRPRKKGDAAPAASTETPGATPAVVRSAKGKRRRRAG